MTTALAPPSPHSRRMGSVIGLAVGDAVGTTVEFMAAGSFTPLTDMVGGGPFKLPAGSWTDDTSMALCLAESLVETGWDPADQMRRYVRWWREGYWSSTDRCFDIGITTREALGRFERSGDPFAGSTAPNSAGNGSAMRLAPVVAWAPPDPERAVGLARESSRTTHGAAECLDGCELLARLLLAGYGGGEVTDPLDSPIPETWSPRLQEIARMGVEVAEQPPCKPTGGACPERSEGWSTRSPVPGGRWRGPVISGRRSPRLRSGQACWPRTSVVTPTRSRR